MKKHLTLVIALMLGCLGLTACSDTGDATSVPTDAATTSAPLKVGMELAYPPFETKDASGNPSGISVDLATDLAAHLGRPVEIQNIAWDGLIPSLQSNKVDVVISSMTITEKRSEVVTFSDPYAKAHLAFLVNSSSPAATVDDLNNVDRTIAVKKGTTGETFVRANLPNAEVTALSSENACVTEVAQGKADAFIYDQLTIYRQNQANAETTRLLAIPDQEPESWGAAVNQDNTALVEQINAFFTQYRADGGFERLTQKHLAAEKATFDSMGFRWFFE